MSLRIAIGKGRGLGSCVHLFEERGLEIPNEFRESRLTSFECREDSVFLVQARTRDLPWLLAHGHVDAAIGSNIWFQEQDHPLLQEAALLEICPCRISLIVPEGEEERPVKSVCTRFPNLTRRRARVLSPDDCQFVYLAGCNEVALSLGFCSAIADIVETGWTLGRMSLSEIQVLGSAQHAIWVRRDARQKAESLRRLLPQVSWLDHGSRSWDDSPS